MGILNVTPDSFSDGGRYHAADHAIAHGLEMSAAGADLIDIGGESTRPGSESLGATVETARVLPVIEELARQVNVPLSIDTSKAAVAAAAVRAGAMIINDVSGLHRDPAMLDVVRGTGAGCVVMHMRGTPATMQDLTCYDDLIAEITIYFRRILTRATAAGVTAEQFVLDPGIGFAKTAAQNYRLIACLGEFRALGRPLLVGPSRKSFLKDVLPDKSPGERTWGTAAACAACVLNGADIVRVHDVAEMRQVAAVAARIRDAGRE
jgi:dihydropteroate synthase